MGANRHPWALRWETTTGTVKSISTSPHFRTITTLFIEMTATIPFLAWGTGFLDFDNDGLLDIFVANGHVYPGVDRQDWGTTWAQRPQLFRNLNGSRFGEVAPATGSGLADVITGRGAAF